MNKTTDTARSIFNDIVSELQPYATDTMVLHHGTYRMTMRCPDLYTERRGAEDDDHPDFTDRDHVVEVAERCAQAKGFLDVKVWDSEKCWFTVELTPNF